MCVNPLGGQTDFGDIQLAQHVEDVDHVLIGDAVGGFNHHGGIGIGAVNPVIASSAVAVVPPERSGMASGANNTFRQVGIATGIALLGTLFSNKVHSEVVSRVTAVHGLSGRGPQIATAVQSGQIEHVLSKLPPQARQSVGMITRAAFTTGLDRILLVAAIIALASGVISLAAIRSKDFAHQGGGSQPAEAGASATPAAG